MHSYVQNSKVQHILGALKTGNINQRDTRSTGNGQAHCQAYATPVAEKVQCRPQARIEAAAVDLHQQALQQGFQAALAVDRTDVNAWLGVAESELTLGRMAGGC